MSQDSFRNMYCKTYISLTKKILLGSSKEEFELKLGQYCHGYIQNNITPVRKIEQAKVIGHCSSKLKTQYLGQGVISLQLIFTCKS